MHLKIPASTFIGGSIISICILTFGEPSFGQQAISNALKKEGNPPELAFLKHLTLPPKLSAEIAQDIKTLSPDEAKQKIASRLRLELLGDGVLDYRAAQKKLLDLSASSAQVTESEGTTREKLRSLARERHIPDEMTALRSSWPDPQVLSAAHATYSKTLLQTNPLIAIDPPSVSPAASGSSGGTTDEGEKFGVAPTQTVPGTPSVVLQNCGIPFNKLDDAGCVKNGQRCETFSRWQFGEVVELTTPDGGRCSGTLITDRWVLSAAHCFLPKTSAHDFSTVSADRQDQKGNAVLQLGDLDHTAVYARYAKAGQVDTYKHVDRVIVNADWDPKKVIQKGTIVTVKDRKIEADWIYAADLALVKIKDADAVTTVTPAALPAQAYVGAITTAGYGVTTVGDGHSGDLWVTWPESPLRSANGELELDQLGGPNISTFCEGDSGGPAFEGRNRGCPAATGEVRPRVLIGVTSHYYGQIPTESNTDIQEAGFCMNSPVMRFINMASADYRAWVCSNTGNAVKGCS